MHMSANLVLSLKYEFCRSSINLSLIMVHTDQDCLSCRRLNFKGKI